MLSTLSFVADLPSLARFADVVDPDRFAAAPDDWRLYGCDIVNSTGAIAAGRYKAVNMAGAACIVAAINAARGIDLAYVFGGDGASILVPDARANAVDAALSRTRQLIANGFGLEMRVGAVPIPDLRARGAELKVAMLELSPGNRLAMFSGGGATLADRLIKGDIAGDWRIAEPDEAAPDLDGLSCRWQALAARRGAMICLLAVALSADPGERARTYGELLAAIERILAGDIAAATPVRADNLQFRWPPRGLGLEATATRADRPRWRRLLSIAAQSLAQALAEGSGLRIGAYQPRRYRAELMANADYRRFDDVLRLVLDVTPDQRQALERHLAELHQRGEIAFGLHVSDRALMTCLLFDLEASRHLHLIDGWGGGFTLAARAMKAQVAGRSGH